MNAAASKLKKDSDDWRWEAILSKNAEMDGLFYFAVRTTGIFCRPSCASRTPNRENISYFYSSEDAKSAGFRACKRCKPDGDLIHSPQKELVVKALRELSFGDEIDSVGELSERLNISQERLQLAFKKIIGINPKAAIGLSKLEHFKKNVRELSVTDAIYESGFGSSRAIYENANQRIGMTPATYKKGGVGMTINYAIFNTPIGKMLIAATDKGICSAAFGDNAAELYERVQKEFFAADIVEDSIKLGNIINIIQESFNGSETISDLPIDVKGTAFQLRVWAELRKIKFGETSSYGELAQKMGNPKAYRAVARACATNPVALITPCHRVIGANGKLSGYKWGIDKKAKLLASEKDLSENE